MVRAGGVLGDGGGVGNKGEVSTARCHSANRDWTTGHTPATQSGRAGPWANHAASCPRFAWACCSGTMLHNTHLLTMTSNCTDDKCIYITSTHADTNLHGMYYIPQPTSAHHNILLRR